VAAAIGGYYAFKPPMTMRAVKRDITPQKAANSPAPRAPSQAALLETNPFPGCDCVAPEIGNQGTSLLGTRIGACAPSTNYNVEVQELSLSDITLRGSPVRSASVREGALLGEVALDGGAGADPVSGDGWVGARLAATAVCISTPSSLPSQRYPVQAIIEAVRPDDVALSTGSERRYLYDVRIEAQGASFHLCGDTGKLAAPIASIWSSTGDPIDDPAKFAFACVDAASPATQGVAAKCYRQWKYAPWDPARRDLYVDCTRMARADYCGKGISYTREGTPVNVWDTANIESRSPPTPGAPVQTFEAAWDEKGAICINHHRIAGLIPVCNPQDTGVSLPPYNLLRCSTSDEAQAVAARLHRGPPILFNLSTDPQR